MPETVLIVDDEPRITIALMARLEAAGFTVYHAINGLAGVEAAALHRPDVIVLDIRMPDIDGFDACTRIKRMPGLGETPVVFLTANVEESARERAAQVGAAAILTKPYEADEVIATIKLVIETTKTKETVNNV